MPACDNKQLKVRTIILAYWPTDGTVSFQFFLLSCDRMVKRDTKSVGERENLKMTEGANSDLPFYGTDGTDAMLQHPRPRYTVSSHKNIPLMSKLQKCHGCSQVALKSRQF